MNLLRFTVVDPHGTISFIAHGDALPALLKACAGNPTTTEEFLKAADQYFHGLHEQISNGLAVFDERNVPGHYDAIHLALEFCQPHEQPVFRVVDEVTREMSLRPVKAGAIVFNLKAKRIIQLQNSYYQIARSGRGRVFDGVSLTDYVYSYRLPADWTLVP
jgi:hypothetical protein